MDIKKSVDSILYDRLSSPLFGTFVVSWLIWNWRIWYLTIFVNQDKLPISKLAYIESHYSNIFFLAFYPLISTALLLTAGQWLSNQAFYLHVWFEQRKVEKQDDLQKNVRLNVSKSTELRRQHKKQEEEFQHYLDEKEKEIVRLRAETETSKQANSELLAHNESLKQRTSDLDREISSVDFQLLNQHLKGYFEDADRRFAFNEIYNLLKGNNIQDQSQYFIDLLDGFERIGLVRKAPGGGYDFTSLGRIYKKYFVANYK